MCECFDVMLRGMDVDANIKQTLSNTTFASNPFKLVGYEYAAHKSELTTVYDIILNSLPGIECYFNLQVTCEYLDTCLKCL